MSEGDPARHRCVVHVRLYRRQGSQHRGVGRQTGFDPKTVLHERTGAKNARHPGPKKRPFEPSGGAMKAPALKFLPLAPIPRNLPSEELVSAWHCDLSSMREQNPGAAIRGAAYGRSAHVFSVCDEQRESLNPRGSMMPGLPARV